MKHHSRRVFIALLLLLGGVIALALPENLYVAVPFQGKQYEYTVNPPTIDLTRFNIPVYRAFKTQLGLDLSGGTQVTLEADMTGVGEEDRVSALESAKDVIERRVNFLGIAEPVVQTARAQDAYRIIVELPGITDVNQAVGIIGQTAQLEILEMREDVATLSATPSSIYDIAKVTGITGKDFSRAQVTFNETTGGPEVSVEMNAEGAKKFSELTKRLIGKDILIVLDGYVISNPVISSEIIDGKGRISGEFALDEAKTLAVQLNAGALPVPIHVVEQRVIEASLGSISIEKSIRAAYIGLLFVIIFMIFKYRMLGVISVIALLFYTLISIAVYRLIPITLTLPGIAGFILSIGMAVDSNILIFERFKEEKRLGKPWRMAMEQSFGKAWDSIRDANITTIITCLILFNPLNWQFLPTSGLVRGFAVTLFLGVIISLFTGIIVTRTLIRVLYREKDTIKKK
jgi:preprotein translocase subunit SecD